MKDNVYFFVRAVKYQETEGWRLKRKDYKEYKEVETICEVSNNSIKDVAKNYKHVDMDELLFIFNDLDNIFK